MVKQNWQSQSNRETFKDLLIFEERLKQNAERLQSQRKKYQAFLTWLIAMILWLSHDVCIRPSIYSLVQYGQIALLLVALVTLALFFAAGMYSEKIGYAYKFVPQANRALRPFNIYLNTRTKSRFLAWTAFPRSSSPLPALPPPTRFISSTSSSTTDSNSDSPPPRRDSSPPASPSNPGKSPPGSPLLGPSVRASTLVKPRRTPLAPIPPAANPRGELIFSSRVSGPFREGYERYRAEWERRRNSSLTPATSTTTTTSPSILDWMTQMVRGPSKRGDSISGLTQLDKENETDRGSESDRSRGGRKNRGRERSRSLTPKLSSLDYAGRSPHFVEQTVGNDPG